MNMLIFIFSKIKDIFGIMKIKINSLMLIGSNIVINHIFPYNLNGVEWGQKIIFKNHRIHGHLMV